jgi:two-component system alkaline phosphatase synthesis response regulator PhoP
MDDDVYLMDLMQYALGQEGATVYVARTQAHALQIAAAERIDLAILDVSLPSLGGLPLCKHFVRNLHIRVIAVSAQPSATEEITAFEHGVDDYIEKPFHLQVLIQRLHAIILRGRAQTSRRDLPQPSRRIGTALFNVQLSELMGNGQVIKLSRMQCQILDLLVTWEGQIFSADRIRSRVQSLDAKSSTSVIKTHIRHLRVKLAHVLGDAEVIHTIPNAGYVFWQPSAAPPTRQQA